MHEVMLRLKRGYWRAVLHMREIAGLCDDALTPARFDILYVVARERMGVEQGRIHRTLGLARSTISKMLRRMEQLGLVVRQRVMMDRRQKWVTLTPMGVDIITSAIRAFIHEEPVRHTFEAIRRDRHGKGLPFLRATRLAVERVARYFHDTSSLVYSMRPPTERAIRDENAHHEKVARYANIVADRLDEGRRWLEGAAAPPAAPPPIHPPLARTA